MGYNTTVLILNDALEQIAKDEKFGQKLTNAILSGGREKYIPSGYHCNAAEVIETHHADDHILVSVGCNTAKVVGDNYTFRQILERFVELSAKYNVKKQNKSLQVGWLASKTKKILEQL